MKKYKKMLSAAAVSTALMVAGMAPASALAGEQECTPTTVCVKVGIITVCIDVEVCTPTPTPEPGGE